MTPIPLQEFADKINELFPEILRGMSRKESDELFKGKITLPQFIILNLLTREGELKMTQMARLLNVTTAAATGLVERLVKYGYVQRLFDPNDRRIIKVKLTNKGSEFIKKILVQRRRMIMGIFGRIPESDRNEYLRIISNIHRIITEEDRTG